MYRPALIALFLLYVSAIKAAPFDISGIDSYAFSFGSRIHHALLSQSGSGIHQIKATGHDPYALTEGVVERHNSGDAHILAFEYRAKGDFGKVHFYYQSPEGVGVVDSKMKPSEGWKWHHFDLSSLPPKLEWFRFDFGSREGLEFELRNLRLVKKSGPYEWLGQEYEEVSFAKTGNDLEREDLQGGGLKVETTGKDPYIHTNIQGNLIEPGIPYRIGFQYRSGHGSQELQVLYKTASGLKPINRKLGEAKDWRWEFVELPAGGPVEWLRFDFGGEVGREILLRECRLMKALPVFDVGGFGHSPFALHPRGNDALVKPFPGGGWEIKTTGNDPYVPTSGLVEAHDPGIPYILAFEYQAPEDFDEMVFYYRTLEGNRHRGTDLVPSSQWTWHLHDLSRNGKGLGEKLKSFRIDFGSQPNLSFKIRNCRLIPATKELRIRAAIGEKAGRLDQFGVSLDGVVPQQSAVETVRYADNESQSVTMAAYRHLDLDAETKRLAEEPSAQPPVPLAPRIVAGEGAHPDNHTVVRILSPYQVCESQFLAYPPEIRGGVGVESGSGKDGEPFIVIWPLASEATREIRIFNRHGGWIGKIQVPVGISPPYTVAVGDFEKDTCGDEIALAAEVALEPNPQAFVFTAEGKLSKKLTIPGSTGTYSLLAKDGSKLIAQELDRQVAYPLLPEEKSFPFDEAPGGFRLFDSVFPGREFYAGGEEDLVSTLHLLKEGRASETLDIGRMENMFWFDPQEVHGGDRATWGSFPDGKYIRNSKYNYLGSAQYWSPLVKAGEIEGRSYGEWTDIGWEKVLRPSFRKSIADYGTGVPTVWSAGFTHRWRIHAIKEISQKLDPSTWLPRYLLLDRKNATKGGGYFGKKLFDYGSQHFEDEALEKLYTYAQRAFHRKLAPAFRENPEMTIAVEPNHENEIVSGHDSIGDYNPGNLKGFYQYLIATYGSLGAINRKMGTNFSKKHFDAPRNIFRGEWDRYHDDNRYFQEWVEYNRIVVSRRVGTTFREALLAGFPAELVKCHQIPDSYVFGSIVGIAEGEKRLSPIDWLLTTGAGFGFSRYGTYYDRKHNIGQGAHSSGFDGMLIGEYASLNPSPEKALQQLLYLRDHGVSALHVMWWPSDLDKGFNKAQESALREMVAKHDVPRPGYAGGVAEIRPYKGDAGIFDIASLGTGSRHTGLIKSLRKDGSFEGTVYTVPFHAHVDIDTLEHNGSMRITPTPTLLAKVPDVRPGCVVEVVFTVGPQPPAEGIQIDFACNGVRLEDKTILLQDLTPSQQVRVVYKLPLLLEEVSLGISSPGGNAHIHGLSIYKHQDQVVNLAKKIMEGQRHQGGVTFDWLP